MCIYPNLLSNLFFNIFCKIILSWFYYYCCYPFLGSHKTNTKIKMRKYKNNISKNIRRKFKNNRSEKRMLKCWKKDRNWLRRFINTRIEILTVYFWLVRALGTRKIQFEKTKSKIRCLWTQLNFIQGLIELMESLIARKLIF